MRVLVLEPPRRISKHSHSFRVAAILLTAAVVLVAPVDSRAESTPDDPAFGEYVHVDELPEAIKHVSPVYPDAARRDGIDGTVMVQVLVGKDGRVRDARVVKSIPALNQAAVDAVRQWLFKPALLNNQPVAVWVAVPIKFSVDESHGSPSATPPPPDPAVPSVPAPRRALPRSDRNARPGNERAMVEALVNMLREKGPPRAPSVRDALERERVIRMARRLDPRLEAPADARRHFDAALAARDRDEAPDLVMGELTAALHVAPWWSEPYREIGRVQELSGDLDGAVVSFELYLVADPDAADWEEVRMRIKRLKPRIADWY